MADKKTTIQHIAKACGVTTATVSRAINNKPGMRDELRKHILQYIESIGWTCKSLKSRFIPASEGTRHVVMLGNIWTASGTFIQMENTLGILIEKLSANGFSSSVVYGNTVEAIRQCLEIKPYAVVMLYSSLIFNVELEKLKAAGIRVIVIYGSDTGHICPTIQSDHKGAASLAAAKLVKNGAKRIGLFGGFGMLPHPSEEYIAQNSRLKELCLGIQTAVPTFKAELDAVSDSYGNPEEFRNMLKSGDYDSWICIGRKFFNAFCFYCNESGVQVPVIIFGSETDAYDPLLRYDHFSEESDKIAMLAFKILSSEVLPESMEYNIPYVWKEKIRTVTLSPS